MKKIFELLGNEISNHFDDPLLSNRITKALNDAYEDGGNWNVEIAQLAQIILAARDTLLAELGLEDKQ